jgi:hypothetical protein
MTRAQNQADQNGPDIDLTDDESIHIVRVDAGDGKGKGPLVRPPFPSGKSHQDHFKPEGDDDQSQCCRVLGPPQESQFEEDTQKDGEYEGNDHGPGKRNMIAIQQGKGHKGTDHGHLPLGEVEHFGPFVDDHHGKSKQSITGSNRQPAHNQLTQHTDLLIKVLHSVLKTNR